MKVNSRSMCIAIMAGVLAESSFADTHYVNVNSTTPAAPYTNWATAATNIQDAIDAAEAGDVVLVTNGVYATGQRVTPGYTSSNRVVITKDITVTSVNGPAVTIIRGHGPLGNSAVRGVFMTNGLLSGFTITNGFTRTSGSVFYDLSGGGVSMYSGNGVVSNCVISGNSAQSHGGGTLYGTVNNCTISGNNAHYGGGTDRSTANNCTISGNHADHEAGGTAYGAVNNCTISGNTAFAGGGTYNGTVNKCTIGSNSATFGGGTYFGTVNNCVISGNTAAHGGGSSQGTVNNCAISGNSAAVGGGTVYCTVNNCVISGNCADYGGGTYFGTVNNCVISGNTAGTDGGGTSGSLLLNCTVTGNVATNLGGGIYLLHTTHAATNCVIYRNRCINDPASSNWYVSAGTIVYSCTAPLPPGAGNIESDPRFVNAASGDYRLAYGSPCINAGVNLPGMASQKDLDGNPRIQPEGGVVDMGAYEAYSITSNVLDPPALTAPIVVPAGGSATITVTNWSNVMLCGEKAPDIFVTAPWLTNNVAQMLDSTAWTNAFVALVWSLSGATNVIVFRCVSNDWMTYSAATTTVVIINQQMLPFVDITNESATVPYETTTATIAGTNNAFAAGGLCWSNLLTAASGAAQGSGFAFQVSEIALAVGVNPLLVYGTNTLGDTGDDSVTITRLPEAVAPVIEPDALVFPATNETVLDAGMLTAIVWRVSGIWDNLDGTNLLLPSIAILATNSGAVVTQVGTNVPNVLGALDWSPWGMESERTAYVVRIEVIDSAGNATNRVFVDNVFTVVPEPAWLGLTGIIAGWRRKRDA